MALYGRPMLSRMFVHLALGYLTAYRALDEVAQLRGLFDSRAAPGAQMEDELTAVRVRKKVLTEPRTRRNAATQVRKKMGTKRTRRWTSAARRAW